MEISDTALLEFFSECDEILQQCSATLTAVEQSGKTEVDDIDSLYRGMHTIKGSAQLFGFQLISQVAHAMEAALEPIRRMKLQIVPVLIDELFTSIDLIDRIIKSSVAGKKESSDSFLSEAQTIVPELLSIASMGFGGELILSTDRIADVQEKHLMQNAKDSQPSLSSKPIQHDDRQDQPVPEPPSLAKKSDVTMTSEKSNSEKANLEKTSAAKNIDEDASQKEVADTGGNDASANEANSTIRIPVSLLDKLMNLVGEMVLVRNQMLQYGQKHDALEYLNLSQRLDIVTSDLQAEVMKTRMQPIGNIFAKFQRVVRDLGKELGKQIELTTQGSETELDKTLLEAIKDPLTHIIRNSCDHGLETPDERLKAGKSAKGHIRIRSFQEGGHVIIEVGDDGRGLNLKRLLEKALERKIITQEEAAKLSETETANLIFAPGFSTAEKVTSVSGRGVGMDVVRTNLEKIGGQVELHNQQSRGMVVRMRIPLTLAIVPALIVRACTEQFAIPQVKLAELVRVEKASRESGLEWLQGKPVYRLRGQLLPLIDLRETQMLDGRDSADSDSEYVNIVVLNAEDDTFGLIVDEIKDTADIVVKPLSNFLKKLQLYSGATIMGDGSVSLIIDVSGIAQKARLFQKSGRKEASADLMAAQKVDLSDSQDFLFFKLNSKETFCLPLCLVHRLEELPAALIQHSGKQKLIKYRDSILPIISLNEVFGLESLKQGLAQKDIPAVDLANESISLIVVQRHSRMLGLEVNEVVDILTIDSVIEDPVREVDGILGSLIVDNDVVTVIDVFAVIDKAAGVSLSKNRPVFAANELGAGQSTGSSSGSSLPLQQHSAPFKNVNILFAEDTVFFVKQVTKLLEGSGYSVTHAPNGETAWQILSSAPAGKFNLVLSDIEMPIMNGFELAETIRADQRFADTPLIAITTKFREVDLKRGHEVGFNRYLEKLRGDELLDSIHEILKVKAHG